MRLPGSQQVAIGKRLFEQYPWHRFRPHPEWVASLSGLSGAQAVGIADGVRIIYVPNPESVTVRHLGAKRVFTACYFDPLSGGRTKIGFVVADAAGTWTCDPPPAAHEDWVLVLETP